MFPLIKYLFFFVILIKLCANVPQCPPFNPNNPPVFFPHEYDCTLFYRCEESGPVLMQCWPPGTHWSTETNRCEWEANANCNLPGSPTTTSTTTPMPTTTTSTTTTTTTTTTMPPTTTTTPPTTTSTTTTVPTTTTSTPFSPTPPITTTTVSTTLSIITTTPFSPTPPPFTTTTTIPSTTQLTTTTTIQSTTIPSGPCPPTDNPNDIIFVEDPSDCSAYFMCLNGQAVRRQCEAPLLWNQQQSWCDFPSNVPCRICPLVDNPNRLIFFPHSSDCTRYYLCFSGHKLERQCWGNLFWDDRSSWCDFPQNVLCR